MRYFPNHTSKRTTLRALGLSLALPLAFMLSGCVYYNTFYNARKNFNEAENSRMESEKRGGRRVVSSAKYKTAITKASVVLEKHPDSKYYDDALYVIGVSYYWTEEYLRSQRKFRELLANFEESEYVIRSKLYLAKCKLALDERAEAVTIFQSLLETVKDAEIRAEAAFAIGDYYFEQGEYTEAEEYYQSLVDSLASNDAEKRRATLKIADGNFSRFNITDARQRYLEVLDMNPDEQEEYRTRFALGACSYFLQDIAGGIESFQALADDERYYDSIGSIRLKIARGYELDDDLILATEEYEAISVESERSPASGAALYNLGLIYQFDYEDLDRALEYYNAAKKKGRPRNPFYEESVKRAADITKLADFQIGLERDSSTTLDQLDKASRAQLRLGELFLFDLDQPDSAINAFNYAVDSFPEAYYTPRALISMALAHRDYLDDTTTFDSLAHLALERYPKSDFYTEALAALDLTGSAVDSGHPASYFKRAETWLTEKSNLDSARFYYQWVVDSFPRSKLSPQAQFSLIWLQEQQQVTEGDSTVIFAYAELAESYPEHEFGKLASGITSGAAGRSQSPELPVDELADNLEKSEAELAAEQDDRDETDSDETAADGQDGPFSAEDLTLNPELRFYIGQKNQQLWDAPKSPAKLRDLDFIYPSTAASQPEFFDLYYQVKLDYDGSVLESLLMNPTEFEELNEGITEQVDNFIFNMSNLGDLGYGDGWFVHKYRVKKPDYLR